MKTLKCTCPYCSMEAEIKYDEENFATPEFCTGCGRNIALDMEEMDVEFEVENVNSVTH